MQVSNSVVGNTNSNEECSVIFFGYHLGMMNCADKIQKWQSVWLKLQKVCLQMKRKTLKTIIFDLLSPLSWHFQRFGFVDGIRFVVAEHGHGKVDQIEPNVPLIHQQRLDSVLWIDWSEKESCQFFYFFFFQWKNCNTQTHTIFAKITNSFRISGKYLLIKDIWRQSITFESSLDNDKHIVWSFAIIWHFLKIKNKSDGMSWIYLEFFLLMCFLQIDFVSLKHFCPLLGRFWKS